VEPHPAPKKATKGRAAESEGRFRNVRLDLRVRPAGLLPNTTLCGPTALARPPGKRC
jgi:hypothetical protein